MMSRKDVQQLKLSYNEKSTIKDDNVDIGTTNFETAEKIVIKPSFDKTAITSAEHLDFVAGIPPYLRGPYSTTVSYTHLTLPTIYSV